MALLKGLSLFNVSAKQTFSIIEDNEALRENIFNISLKSSKEKNDCLAGEKVFLKSDNKKGGNFYYFSIDKVNICSLQ